MHIMVDLETLDKRKTAIIRSIGACYFWLPGEDPNKKLDKYDEGGISERFYVNIDEDSCRAVGLTDSPSTIDWWSRQSDEARGAFLDPLPIPLYSALLSFFVFAKRARQFWANSPSFDLEILENAYQVSALAKPWKYYQERDCRTAKALADYFYGPGVGNPERTGAAHNALDDAAYQAESIIHYVEHIRSGVLT